jgi:hypothetical protein
LLFSLSRSTSCVQGDARYHTFRRRQKQNKNRLSVTLYRLLARNHWQQYECLVRDDTLTTTHSGQNRKRK